MTAVDGVVIVDKPSGMTSHDVVDAVRKTFQTRRVGHAGTLDPDATGILILGVGKATRFLSYAQDAPKRYLASVRFGTTTTTQDASGDVLEQRIADIGADDVTRELARFVGPIEQVPPMVSAVKVGGERLYRKARRGEEVERPARRVHIYSARLVSFRGAAEPEADLDVTCSAGTYIRSLAHDLGVRLGCGAHLRSLRRTEAGGFTLEDARPLQEIGRDALLPMTESVRCLPATEVDAEDAAAVAHGRPLGLISGDLEEGAPTAVVHRGGLLAVYRRRGGGLVAERVVPR